jgi:uncharacterized protein YtpQ (UPF0354 family)
VAWFRRGAKSAEDRFADEVAGMIRSELGVKVRTLPDFALEIDRGDGQPVTMNLHNVFAEAQQLDGEARRSRLRTAVLAMAPRPVPVRWDETAPRLLPAVRAASWAAASGPPDVLRRPLVPLVSLMCAIDSEHAMTFATGTDLQNWSVTEDDALRQAVDNLAGRPLEVGRAGTIAVVLGPDGYVSSWLAAPAVLAQVADELGGEVIAVAATRDQLVLVDAEDATATMAVLDDAMREYRSAPRQLSPVPYRIGVDRIEVWRPPQDHPARVMVDRATHVLNAVEYGHQRARLQDLFARTGEEVFVAGYMLMEQGTGSMWSWAAWARQVTDGLLPQVDLLLFGDNDSPETEFAVPWSDAVRLAGDALEWSGYDPPLWRHHGWPDAETLALLQASAVPFPPLA